MNILKRRWLSPRIVFAFVNCPSEKDVKMCAPHCPMIHNELTKINELEKDLMKKAVERAKFEELDKDPRLKDKNDF